MFANVPKPEEVKLPPFAEVKNRLVVEAVVANSEVVVAFVVVERVMLLKMFAPVNVLLSESRVVEAVLSVGVEQPNLPVVDH